MNKVPGKTTSYTNHQTLYSETPIRVGEMEFNVLTLVQDMEGTVKKLLDQYSSSPGERRNLIETLLTKDVFDLGEIDLIGDPSVTAMINRTYLKCLGMELQEIEDCEEE